MFGSFLAIIIKGNYDVGGAGVVFDRNYQSGRIELFNFEPDMRMRHTVWSLVIGMEIDCKKITEKYVHIFYKKKTSQ